MSMNKAELLNELRLKTELVKLDDGKEVIVSEVGAADYIKLWTNHNYQTDGNIDMAKFTPALLAYSIVDEQNQCVFTDEDIPSLARAAQGPFMKIAEAARRLNGLAGNEAKNSEETAQEDSSLSSVSN